MEHRLSVEAQLEDLATYFEAHVELVLKAWRKAVDGDERLTTVTRMGRSDFEDNIPASLQVLVQHFRSREAFSQDGSADGDAAAGTAEREEALHAHEHGFHRWQAGYDIRELLLEWGHLHFCLVGLFNEYEIERPNANREAMNWGRMALAGLMNGGFSQSVAEYTRLQQTEAQEIVRGLSDALKQVSALQQQRGQLLRQAVHDLHGNLSTVQAATGILGAVAGPDADLTTQNSVFDLLQRGTSTLGQMLTELLDLARLEAGQEERSIESFDAGTLLGELCSVAQPLTEKSGLYLKVTGPASLPVEGDPVMIRRIVQNILLNAIKYTGQGGVTVSWNFSEPNQWFLVVEDTGPGIATPGSPSMMQELVQPETTVDSSVSAPTEASTRVRGEGVGLAIVKRLCELLDAKIEMLSSAQGATVQITFPRHYCD